MSWASLANNETVNQVEIDDAVVNGVFIPKGAIDETDFSCITKSEADALIYIDTTHPSYVALAANELVTKADLVSSLVALNLNIGGTGNSITFNGVNYTTSQTIYISAGTYSVTWYYGAGLGYGVYYGWSRGGSGYSNNAINGSTTFNPFTISNGAAYEFWCFDDG